MEDIQKYMLEQTNLNRSYREYGEIITEISNYVFKKHPHRITFNESILLAKRLVKEAGYTKEEVMLGKADNEIYKFIRAKLLKEKSIAKKNQKNYMPLKTRKKTVNRKIIKNMILISISVAGVIAIKDDVNEYKVQERVSTSIAKLTSSFESDDYIHNVNIANQNRYPTNSLDENNKPYVSYNYGDFAADIQKVYEIDSDLLDVTISNAYYSKNIKDTKTKLLSMDKLIDEVKKDLYNKELDSCEVFLDYVIKVLVRRDKINIESENYSRLINAIEAYKKDKNINFLPEDIRENIKYLVKEYEDLNKELNIEYVDSLEVAVEERRGGRGG